MATVIFFAKPGCATNLKQIKLLQAAGHEVQVRDLLAEPWTAERLQGFFGELPATQWFNRAAPRVKAGEMNVEVQTPESAMPLLLAEHLLIRRPLLEIAGQRFTGFDPVKLGQLIDLPAEPGTVPPEGCSRDAAQARKVATAG